MGGADTDYPWRAIHSSYGWPALADFAQVEKTRRKVTPVQIGTPKLPGVCVGDADVRIALNRYPLPESVAVGQTFPSASRISHSDERALSGGQAEQWLRDAPTITKDSYARADNKTPSVRGRRTEALLDVFISLIGMLVKLF